MRAGGCAVQQALTSDAAAVVKQAVTLAKRRGHAQVTPLHVANTMLASPTGLLRVACLQSHSHPLQCKALELCFNVALNRLPASSPNPMLGTLHSQYPSISNALVAAFKRAQAHQRRGSIENQQQPLLAVKIELEQLIISILDDPSVSRVMREAGFSSPQVKINVEKAVSLEICSQNSPNNNTSNGNTTSTLSVQPSTIQNQRKTIPDQQSEPAKNEDMNIIIETLLSNKKRKSLVIVGECISSVESTVRGLMDRVDKGTVPEELTDVKFISIPPLYSFCNLHREEVEQKIGELACLVKSLMERGVVLYLGDLKWISDYNVEKERGYYCSVEHMIMELGRLVCGIGEIGRFWLMGIATFQTYMRCRTGYNSLENVWGLHPVTIPSNSLGLSLISECGEQREDRINELGENGCHQPILTNIGEMKLNCCVDCSANFETEARNLQTNTNEPTSMSSQLPPWLQEESRRIGNCDNKNGGESIRELCKKWNSYCSSVHKERTLIPLSSSASTSPDQHTNPNPLNQNPFHPFPKNLHHNVPDLERGDYVRNPFSSNPSSTPNSTSSGDVVMDLDGSNKFREFNAENLNILCNALEKKVPWQKEIIPEIAGTVLQCRSGMLKRKDMNGSDRSIKEETWMFFLGEDAEAKEKISRELARIVFGSYLNFISIGLSSFNSSISDECRNKRGRDDLSCMERFVQAVCANPHRVFLVEDLDEADYRSQMCVKRAIERGKISLSGNGEEVSFSDAIVVLSCERFRSRSPSTRKKIVDGEEERGSNVISLDLNISFGDESEKVLRDMSVDELGILENVDRCVVFKVHDL